MDWQEHGQALFIEDIHKFQDPQLHAQSVDKRNKQKKEQPTDMYMEILKI